MLLAIWLNCVRKYFYLAALESFNKCCDTTKMMNITIRLQNIDKGKKNGLSRSGSRADWQFTNEKCQKENDLDLEREKIWAEGRSQIMARIGNKTEKFSVEKMRKSTCRQERSFATAERCTGEIAGYPIVRFKSFFALGDGLSIQKLFWNIFGWHITSS